MSGTQQQRAAFGFLQRRGARPFTTADLVAATGYTEGTAGTHLSEHWAAVVEKDPKGWRARPVLTRMTLGEFLAAISQSKRAKVGTGRRYLLLDANVLVAYYLPKTTRSKKLATRAQELLDSVRDAQNASFLYVPNFCIAETFSIFMKHRFGGWNKHVTKKIPNKDYWAAVDAFQADIHNGKLIYQYELNRYHILGINLVAPVDHHYQMARPKRKKKSKKPGKARKGGRTPTPAGTFDQLILSMGVQLAHQHGAANTIIVTADKRLADLVEKCRKPMSPTTSKKLGLDRCEAIVGRPFRPETFPNGVNLLRASKSKATNYTGCHFSV